MRRLFLILAVALSGCSTQPVATRRDPFLGLEFNANQDPQWLGDPGR